MELITGSPINSTHKWHSLTRKRMHFSIITVIVSLHFISNASPSSLRYRPYKSSNYVPTKSDINKTLSCRTNSTCIVTTIDTKSYPVKTNRTGDELSTQNCVKNCRRNSLRVFKHTSYDPQPSNHQVSNALPVETVHHEEIPMVQGATTAAWDRSLIPNSFFPIQRDSRTYVNKLKSESVSTTDVDSNFPNRNHTEISTSAERLRRSPFNHPGVQRAALHRPPPRPLPYYQHPHYLAPPSNPYAPVQSAASYSQTPTFDYSGYGYGAAPEDYSGYNRFKRPPVPMPPPQVAHRIPAPRRRPPPPSRYPQRPRVKPGGSLQQPLYSYPKNAANIQDILTYFKDNENEVPEHYDPLLRPPKLIPYANAGNTLRPTSGGSDFSKEIDDVQSSLLKDIKEFAKRPTLMTTDIAQDHSKLRYTSSPSRPTYTTTSAPHKATYDEDESDVPRPKPVRDMAKEHHMQNYHTSGEKGRQRTRNVPYKGKEGSFEDDYRENRERHKHRYESDERPYYHEGGSFERTRSKATRQKNYHHKATDYKNRDSYYGDDKQKQFEESDFRDGRDRTPSPSAPSKPIVLKRPYGTYRPETVHHDKKAQGSYYNNYWGPSAEKDFYPSVPRVRPPSVTYSPASKSPDGKSNHYYKDTSPELIEDIVEIHTDTPYRINTEGREKEREEKERRARLHKLYMEYLEHKLEAERLAAAATEFHPMSPKKHNPMRMKIHIYPNENVKTSDASAIGTSYYYPSPTMGYSNLSPSISSPPVRQSKYRDNSYMGSHSHRSDGVTGTSSYGSSAQMGVDKNKNVVLHLHVHRRNGIAAGVSSGGHAEASEVFTSTVKPLTYKQIFDEYQEEYKNHRHSSNPKLAALDNIDDKSVSMEVPIHEEKIDDVLHSLLQIRQQRNAR